MGIGGFRRAVVSFCGDVVAAAKTIIRIERHKHKCSRCGFVWRHSEAARGDDAAHTCVCGKKTWTRTNEGRAMFVGDGRPTLAQKSRWLGRWSPKKESKR